MANGSDSQKVSEWRRRMARFEKSSRTVTRFCQDEGVSVPSFYHWRKRLQQSPRANQEANLAAANFAPVRLVASASVSVRLPGGTQLEVPAGDLEVLQSAIRTLAQVDAQRVTGEASC